MRSSKPPGGGHLNLHLCLFSSFYFSSKVDRLKYLCSGVNIRCVSSLVELCACPAQRRKMIHSNSE